MTSSVKHRGSLNFVAPKDFASVCVRDRSSGPAATKLIATLGPQSRDVGTLTALIRAGMSGARFDLTYGKLAFHLETLQNLKQAIKQAGQTCAVLVETAGPEIVVNNWLETDHIQLVAGSEVQLKCDGAARCTSSCMPISLGTFQGSGVSEGQQIFIGPYLFTGDETTSAYLTVKAVVGDSVRCTCNNNCMLEGATLTVRIAGMRTQGPILTQKDTDALKHWAAEEPEAIDFVSLSFTRTTADVAACRELLNTLGLRHVLIVAKIEDREGLMNVQAIAEAADGIIFSRGNLGVDIPPERMFLAQKLVIAACNSLGKFIAVARVVDTMTDAPRPTRAEATDVANLVLDGTDGILLGSETFHGKYVVDTVQTVLAIARQAETAFDNDQHYEDMLSSQGGYDNMPMLSKMESLASSAVRAATKVGAALIVSFTKTLMTPRYIAKYKPGVPILAVVGCKESLNGEALARQALLLRGTIPVLADETLGRQPDGTSTEGAMLRQAILWALSNGLCEAGSRLIVCGSTEGTSALHFMNVDDIVQNNTGLPSVDLPHVGSNTELSRRNSDADISAKSPDCRCNTADCT